MGFYYLEVVFGHEVEVEEGEVLGVGVFDRDELGEYVCDHLSELRGRL